MSKDTAKLFGFIVVVSLATMLLLETIILTKSWIGAIVSVAMYVLAYIIGKKVLP